MEVHIEELQGMNERRRQINAVPFDEIVWMVGGQPIELTAQQREDWRFVGMSNTCFVECGLTPEGTPVPVEVIGA